MKTKRLSGLLERAETVVMLGMCKNAGKTTALCRLIRELAGREEAPLALTGIGRDGESTDLVTGTEKPPIFMYEGMLAATARELLPLSDVSREILVSTGLYTSLGEVMIFRARSDGFVQLAGPSIVDQLGPLRTMLKEQGAGRLLIDGALNRRSHAVAAAGGAVILSTGASLDRSMLRVIEETAYTAKLLTLPLAGGREESTAVGQAGTEYTPGGASESRAVGTEYTPRGASEARTAGQPPEERFTLIRANGEAEGIKELSALQRRDDKECLLVKGAFTESQAKALLLSWARKEGLTVQTRDASCLMLQRESFEALNARGVRFAVESAAKLAAVTVNPVSAGGWTFPAEEFRAGMQEAVPVPVLNVMEMEEDDDPADI